MAQKVTSRDIAMMIDLSLLNPSFTLDTVKSGCETAKKYSCVSVCVRPCDVELAATILKGTPVITTTVIGFPHGSNLTKTKVFEAKLAIEQGCGEVDMVANIGRVLSGDYDYVEADIAAVAEEVHKHGALLKVILENAYLSDEQKIRVCKICANAGADFTKTSTGYAPGGATLHDLKLMRANTPQSMQIKAAGGVRSLDDALLVRAVGASRFGCTRTETIMEDAMAREKAGTLLLPVITDETELASVLAAKKQ